MASSDWVLVDDPDPRIQYSPGWQAFENGSELDGTKHGAAAAGLTATFTFTGTQVIVVGSLGSVDVHGIPTSRYTLDGSDVGSYTAPVVAPGFFRLNVTFFSSRTLAPGDHTLVITNVNGTSPNVFWLDYVEYIASAASTTTTSSSSSSSPSSSSLTTTPATSSSPSSSSSSSQQLTTSSTPPASNQLTPTTSLSFPASSQTPPSDTNTSTTPASSSSHNHTGAIAGGIVGGAALLLALALLLVCLRRRRRHGASSTSPFADPDPPIRPFSSWRGAGADIDEAPSQKQMSMMAMAMAGVSTPTPTPTPSGLSPTLSARAGPPPSESASGGAGTERLPSSEPGVTGEQQPSPRSRFEPRVRVMQSVDSGLRLAGDAVMLPPPYTRE
ncbi:hypothetical protein GSI_01439 [Ganoderma sinense ZZ0214-1]|uniref:Uncharacterized protein n=1 Tax=Ganoderma sinense ZZ0214-1 TaxID=1077348 RepID=A0A2G8SVE5_9APHY|nr:hypothetical protein GSI_01439 [Ganoderma sinense ZZ0214-1]